MLIVICKAQSTFSCYVKVYSQMATKRYHNHTLVSFLFKLSEQRVYRINLQVASRMLKRLNQQLRRPQQPQSCMPKPKHLLEHIPYLSTWIPSEDVLHWNTLNAISTPVHVTRCIYHFLFRSIGSNN